MLRYPLRNPDASLNLYSRRLAYIFTRQPMPDSVTHTFQYEWFPRFDSTNVQNRKQELKEEPCFLCLMKLSICEFDYCILLAYLNINSPLKSCFQYHQ